MDSTFPTRCTLQCLQTRNSFGERIKQVHYAVRPDELWQTRKTFGASKMRTLFRRLLNPHQSMHSGFHWRAGGRLRETKVNSRFGECKILEPLPRLAWMFFVRILIRSGCIRTFRSDLSKKQCYEVRAGMFLKILRLGVLQQHVLQNSSFLFIKHSTETEV